MKTAIFLGAGASAAEGAPTQDSLFREYFTMLQKEPDGSPVYEMDCELPEFFLSMFGIDVQGHIENCEFMLDLSEKRKETFKDYDLESANPAGGLTVTVFNKNPANKNPIRELEEAKRYKRFFKKGTRVDYTNYSFQDFVKEPGAFIKG